MIETFYEVMRRKGISRRSYLKYCSLTATSLGLAPSFVPQIAHAMENKPRTPVLWLHGLECTCCTESFIRSAHPLAKDVVLSMISLDYDDTLMAAAGHQAEAILEEIMTKYKGQYILAVEGNPPLNEDGMFCIQVDDNGPGVPEDRRERVFEPFFTTKDVGSGTGLGLAIAYGVVRSHGGTIAIERAVQGGASFIIRIPERP